MPGIAVTETPSQVKGGSRWLTDAASVAVCAGHARAIRCGNYRVAAVTHANSARRANALSSQGMLWWLTTDLPSWS